MPCYRCLAHMKVDRAWTELGRMWRFAAIFLYGGFTLFGDDSHFDSWLIFFIWVETTKYSSGLEMGSFWCYILKRATFRCLGPTLTFLGWNCWWKISGTSWYGKFTVCAVISIRFWGWSAWDEAYMAWGKDDIGSFFSSQARSPWKTVPVQ